MMLAGIVALTIALPLAVASAGPTGGEAPESTSAPARASAHPPAGDPSGRDAAAVRAAGRGAFSGEASGEVSGHAFGRTSGEAAGETSGEVAGEAFASGLVDDGAPGAAPASSVSPLTLGVGLATAARCGPELTSTDGIEAQTCVLTQGRDTWARTYYRNATGDDLTSVLTLMAPGDRTVRMHCAVDADDEPGACETPRERTVGEASAYLAVAEFAADADGPLLLRSGSNSPVQNGR